MDVEQLGPTHPVAIEFELRTKLVALHRIIFRWIVDRKHRNGFSFVDDRIEPITAASECAQCVLLLDWFAH